MRYSLAFNFLMAPGSLLFHVGEVTESFGVEKPGNARVAAAESCYGRETQLPV
jgi:hypothetical protein